MGEWINVNDRPPNEEADGDCVLAISEHGDVCSGYLSGDEFYWHDETMYAAIAYWMPIPPLPEEFLS